MKLSACIITFNEEEKIEACLKSVSFADEIVLVDSGSEDRTLEIAGAYTDRIFVKPFEDFSSQKNFAIAQATGDWILSVDADEVVTGDLAREIVSVVKADNRSEGYHGYYINRINYMYGRRLNHFAQPDYKIRLTIHFNPGSVL